MTNPQTSHSNNPNRGLNTPIGKAMFKAKRAVAGTAIFSFFINLLMLTGPLYMLQVYDRVLISRSLSTLLALSILMAVLYVFMGVLELCRSRVLTRLATDFEKDLGEKTYKSWLKRGLSVKPGDEHSPMKDLFSLKQFLSGNGPSSFFDLPWIFVYVGVIFLLHWTLGVIALLGTAALIIFAIYNEIVTREPLQESMRVRRKEVNLTEQTHRNADVIQAMGMGRHMREKWAKLHDKRALEMLSSTDRAGSTTATTKAFRMFLQSAILGAGGALAIQQIVTPGAMIAGSIILGRAMAPVQGAISQWRGFNAAKAAYKRLNVFLEAGVDEGETTRLPAPQGFLSVENMVAGPPGATQATLLGLNFKLPPGSGLGVIGPSASGKSTLARLLTGIWIAQKGTVRLDGASFDQWDPDELGPYIGYLPQKVELLDGTIRQNIARFNPDASDADVVAAAQLAGVHELILRFKEGYDSHIGEGGIVLSGGQIQRLALARAVFGRPVLVVLDEPNASLDAEGDIALTRAISALRQAGTSVVVMAHRPSAIAAVDKLLVLRSGKQVAFGPKAEVLAALNSGVAARRQQSAAKARQTTQRVAS